MKTFDCKEKNYIDTRLAGLQQNETAIQDWPVYINLIWVISYNIFMYIGRDLGKCWNTIANVVFCSLVPLSSSVDIALALFKVLFCFLSLSRFEFCLPSYIETCEDMFLPKIGKSTMEIHQVKG